jgi:hypothetical protein
VAFVSGIVVEMTLIFILESQITLLNKTSKTSFFTIQYFIKYNVNFFKENDDEILPLCYTWKVIEKGLKIKRVMWC